MTVSRRALMVSTLLAILFPLVARAQESNEEFFAAARKGDVAAVRAILDKGVDVNTKTRYGATALSYACDKGHLELAKLLIERGADVNVKDTFYGEVPLGWALSRGHADIVKLLLSHGAAGAERALAEGVQSGNLEIVRAAVEKGALKPETLNNALRRASAGGNKEIIELLKKAGAVVVEVNVDPEILKGYAGIYKNDQIGELTIDVKDGKLSGKLGNQFSFTSSPISQTSFALVEVDATITFSTEGGRVTAFTLNQPGRSLNFKRLEQK